jgi:hypothetical protein
MSPVTLEATSFAASGLGARSAWILGELGFEGGAEVDLLGLDGVPVEDVETALADAAGAGPALGPAAPLAAPLFSVLVAALAAFRVLAAVESAAPLDAAAAARLAVPAGFDWSQGADQSEAEHSADQLPEAPYECSDGAIWIAVPTAAQRADVRALLDGAGLAEGPLGDGLRRWLAVRSRAEAFAEAREWRFPWAPLLSESEVEADSQLAANGISFGGSGASLPIAERARSAPRPAARRAPGPQPLSGLRVVDLTAVWSGPLAGALLASLGAEVLKVEAPARAAAARAAGPPRLPSYTSLNGAPCTDSASTSGASASDTPGWSP